jgi:hypothetical protein
MMLWPHQVFSCSDIWICGVGHKGASIGESLEYFGGKIIGNKARNWDSMAGQNWQAEGDELSLDSMQ